MKKNNKTISIKSIRGFLQGVLAMLIICVCFVLCDERALASEEELNEYDATLLDRFYINGTQNYVVSSWKDGIRLEIKPGSRENDALYIFMVFNMETQEYYEELWAPEDQYVIWYPESCGLCYFGLLTVDSEWNHYYSYNAERFANLEEGTEEFYKTMDEELTKLTLVESKGLAKAADGNWYYYVNGQIDTTYTGLAKNENGWWYVKNGKLDRTYTGLAKNENGWWYVKNGKLDRTYTGLAKNENGWWYVKNGKLDRTYTGLAKNEYGWWYVKNGKLDRTTTGLIKNTTGKWVYVKQGKFDTTYTGLAKNEYGWWYVKNGVLDRSVTGLVKNTTGKWVYVKQGKFDTSYTGIAKNANGSWYVKNGVLDFSYTGALKFNGVTYNIKAGKVV